MKLTFTLTKTEVAGKLGDTYKPLNNYNKDGSITKLRDTNLFDFDFNHPVNIECQRSYDNSVNLILYDGKNAPKLINTRFSKSENGEFKIIDRTGDSDTNIYNATSFKSDSSLFKTFNTFAKYNNYELSSGGDLKVGNYTFYFKYADADDNETNIFAKTSAISCYCGTGDKKNGAYNNYNSGKQITISLSDLDTSFIYLYIYYSRTTSDQFGQVGTTCHKILDKISIDSSDIKITITGNENVQDISETQLNIKNEILNSNFAAAQSNNTLFLANIQQHYIDYENLKDLSLRIYPEFTVQEGVEDKVGYYPGEYYRFGIVYIYNNNTQSPAFPIRGQYGGETWTPQAGAILDNDGNRIYLKINEDHIIEKIGGNSEGISQVPSNSGIIGVKFNFSQKDVFNKVLEEQGISGYYMVRQKRIPTILAQALIVPTTENLGVPIMNFDLGSNKVFGGYDYYVPSFHGKGLSENGYQKLASVPGTSNTKGVGISQKYACAICPEHTVRQPYLNTLFSGEEFYISPVEKCTIDPGMTIVGEINGYFVSTPITLVARSYESYSYQSGSKANIQFVKDDVPNVKLKDVTFHSRCGTAEELKQFVFNREKKSDLVDVWDNYGNGGGGYKDNEPIVRGIFGPYLAIYMDGIQPYLNKLVNIYVPGFNPNNRDINQILKIRYTDYSAFSQIGNRHSIYEDQEVVYDGDCYNCTFTQRIIRNFQDPSAPNNDDLVKTDGYKQAYVKKGATNIDNWNDINRGDINAVKLGMWLTMNLKSSFNLNIRSVDDSYAGEMALTGNARAFYPYRDKDNSGSNKIPESYFINEGLSSNLGVLKDFAYVTVPYTKNYFYNRIYYSNVAVNDGYKNGYRVIKTSNYRDYTTEYGKIIKLIEYNSVLYIIFEHAVGYTTIGAPKASDDNINTDNRLLEQPKIINNTIGSQYPDAVILTPYGIVGLDNTTRKIWYVNSSTLKILSEYRVESFLYNNITPISGEQIVGIQNCKAFYNQQKDEVMFTFYSQNDADIGETAWNLCYSLLTQRFTTFYSWIPLFGFNVHKTFLTLNRDSVKDTVLVNQDYYIKEVNDGGITKFVGSGKYASIHVDKVTILDSNLDSPYSDYLEVNNDIITYKKQVPENTILKTKVEFVGINTPVYSACVLNKSTNTPDQFIYKHGPNKLYQYEDMILPTFWYGKQHPFEFEFIVTPNPEIHKIFNNMVIIGNNSQPESFHYEVVGDAYNFSHQKEEMYFRQEITKALLNYLGSKIKYDNLIQEDYTLQNNQKLWNITRIGNRGIFPEKSTILPCVYYSRLDDPNQIEDNYVAMTSSSKNYSNLSGGEIVKNGDEYHIVSHAKAVNMKEGRLRGNVFYREDRWFVQINPLTLIQKNEDVVNWVKQDDGRYLPSIVIGNNPLPNDIKNYQVKSLPKLLADFGYTLSNIDSSNWGTLPTYYNGSIVYTDAHTRKEAKLKDKYIKIKIRYDGQKQTSVHSILTYYTEVR